MDIKKYYLKTKHFMIDTWLTWGRSRSHSPRNTCTNTRDNYGHTKVLSENKTFYDWHMVGTGKVKLTLSAKYMQICHWKTDIMFLV
jgi:hypothetical protein